MAFHIACYLAKNPSHSPVKIRAKYEGTCQVCQFAIKVGDEMTWTRNTGRKVARATTVQTTESETSNTEAPITNGAHIPTSLLDLDAVAEEMYARLDGRFAAQTETKLIEISVKIDDKTVVECGLQHKMFETLLRALNAGVSVYLQGPSGSGKTHGSMAAAKAMTREFHYCGAIQEEHKLLGFVDAGGTYHSTPFYRAWTEGGLFLWDDMDFSDANAQGAFMAALANGVCVFPNSPDSIPRHKDLAIVAGGNTNGKGATAEYSGRNKLDAAVMNRFAVLEWGYDEDLEMATGPNMAWTKRVQAVRAAVAAKGLRNVLVTPRATYDGAKLLAAGIPQEMVEDMTVFAGCTAEQRASLRAAA